MFVSAERFNSLRLQSEVFSALPENVEVVHSVPVREINGVTHPLIRIGMVTSKSQMVMGTTSAEDGSIAIYLKPQDSITIGTPIYKPAERTPGEMEGITGAYQRLSGLVIPTREGAEFSLFGEDRDGEQVALDIVGNNADDAGETLLRQIGLGIGETASSLRRVDQPTNPDIEAA